MFQLYLQLRGSIDAAAAVDVENTDTESVCEV